MIYKNYFKIEEFFIEPWYWDMEHPKYHEYKIPAHVVNKIINHHLPELNHIRDRLNAPVYISKRSGYRSVVHEIMKGRTGLSEHTFQGLGAVDITCDPEHFDKLCELAKKSGYTRICIYPNKKFIHCDFKATNSKMLFVDRGNGWEFQGNR